MHEVFAKAFRLPENRLRLRQIAVNLRKESLFSKKGDYETAQAHNEKTKRISREFADHLVKQAVAAHSKNPEKTKLDLNTVRKVFSILENHLPAAGLKKPRDKTSEEILRRRVMDAVVTAHLVAVAPRELRKHVKAFMALGNKDKLVLALSPGEKKALHSFFEEKEKLVYSLAHESHKAHGNARDSFQGIAGMISSAKMQLEEQ